MKTLILALLAAAALAAPAGALAHGAHHRSHARRGPRFTIRPAALEHGVKRGFFEHRLVAVEAGTSVTATVAEKLTGTGTSFGTGSATATGTIAGRPLASGTYSAAVATDWTHATTRTDGASCAPATVTLSLVDATSSANSLAESVTGETCAVPANARSVAYVFAGTATVSGATGTLAGATGTGRVLLVEKTDGTVTGHVLSGVRGGENGSFVSFAKHARSQGCGGRSTDDDGD